jgi:hypothetical protein
MEFTESHRDAERIRKALAQNLRREVRMWRRRVRYDME